MGIEGIIELCAKLSDTSLSSVPQFAENIIKEYFSNYQEEFCRIIDYYSYIRPKQVDMYAKLLVCMCQSRTKSVSSIITDRINSGFLLRALFLKGIMPLEQIKERCEKDERLYLFFLPELGIPKEISKKNKDRFKTILNDIDSYRSNDWENYKAVMAYGYPINSPGYYIRHDKQDEFAHLIESGNLDIKSKLNVSIFEINNLPESYSLDVKKPLINLALKYGSQNTFHYLKSKEETIVSDLVEDVVASGDAELINEVVSNETGIWEQLFDAAIEFNDHRFLEYFEQVNSYKLSPHKCLKHFNYKAFMLWASKNNEEEKPENPLLCEACALGLISVVEYLIDQKKIDVNIKDKTEMTPLHWACQNGYLNIATLLFSKGADMHAKCRGGSTPLFIAASHGQSRLVSWLVGVSADANAILTSGRNILHCAAKGGNPDVLKNLPRLSVGFNDQDKNGFTPIHVAASEGNVKFCEALLKIEQVDPRMHTKSDQTVLHLATIGGYLNVLELFFKYPIDINAKDNLGKTALHYAAQKDHMEIVQALLKKSANINIIDNTGKSAIFMPTTKSSSETFGMLLKYNPDVSIKTADGKSILRFLVDNSLKKHLKLLMSKLPDLNSLGPDGKTDKQYLEDHMPSRFVTTLIKVYEQTVHDPKVKTEPSTPETKVENIPIKIPISPKLLIAKPESPAVKFSSTPVSKAEDQETEKQHLAAQQTAQQFNAQQAAIQQQMAAYEAAQQAALKQQQMQQFNAQQAALKQQQAAQQFNAQQAALKQQQAVQQFNAQQAAIQQKVQAQQMRKASLQVPASSQPNVAIPPTPDTMSASQYAQFVAAVKQAQAGQAQSSKSQADINVKDEHGRTLLHIAAKEGHLNGVKMLLDKGADVKAIDNDGKTPLHFAAIGSHLEVCEALVAAGADLKAKDYEKQTPYNYACPKINYQLITLLMDETSKKP